MTRLAHRQASRAKRRYTADPSSFLRVLARVQPFTDAEQAQLNLPVRIAFDSLRRGQGEESDFHTMAAAVNLAMVCAEKIDPLVEQTCITARDALTRMYERHTRLGRWGLDGAALQELQEAIEVYEQLNSLLSAGQVQEALAECYQRMRNGDVVEVQHG